jgi:branched-chain amino acid transport system ATP-binding protein
LSILELKDIYLHFGGIMALNGVGLEIRKGEIFAIIGPNGAGKTSIFNCISGLYHPDRGQILYNGKEISRMSPCRNCSAE